MVKMEIEVTDEQFEKIEILKSQNVDVGQAIDLLFGVQNEALTTIEEEKGDDHILDKLQDAGFDTKIKAKLLEKNFGENETYDRAVHDAKHNLKWSEFFNL